MKNKNGFIASSLMFSFFLVFILLSVLVLTSYTHYNGLIKSLNGNILNELNNKIASKYTGIKSYVKNGKIEKNISPWQGSNYGYHNSYDTGGHLINEMIQIKPGNGNFYQTFSIGKDRVIYVAFKFNTAYTERCTTCTFDVKLNNQSVKTLYYLRDKNTPIAITPSALLKRRDINLNLILYGGIFDNKTVDGNNTIRFEATGLNYDNNSSMDVFGINNIIVVDITNLFIGNRPSNADIAKYLLNELPYISDTEKYSLPKI